MIMNNNNPQSSLPPGFRFHPTDEELILHYLRKKVSSTPLPVSIIAEVDIYKFNPWELPAQATFGEKEWYFFTPRDRKYPNGARPNRAAGSGYWKATGTDKVIMTSSGERLTSDNIGVKKALVFYTGRPPKGSKTNWIMHEYRLAESPCTAAASILRPMKLNKGSPMRLDDWVLCRIYKKSIVSPSAAAMASLMIDRDQAVEEEDRFLLQDITLPNFPIQMNMNMSQKCSSFNNLLDALDYSLLSSLLSEPNHNQTNDLSCFGPPCSNVHSSSFEPQDFSVSGSLDTMYENNGLKRQQSCIFDAEMSYPSTKKFNGSSCNFMNNNGVSQFDISGQHSMFSNHSLLNQHQLVLRDKVQFLG